MNKTILYARNLCYLIHSLNLISIIALAGVVVYSLIEPTAFQNIVVTDLAKAGFGIGDFKICTSCVKTTDTVLSDLGASIKVWVLFRGALFSLLLFLVVKRIINILRSVSSREAFYVGNVLNFKRMALYGFIASVFSAFNYIQVGGTGTWYFTLPLAPISFAIGCLVLAEVFKEGQALAEDKQSII